MVNSKIDTQPWDTAATILPFSIEDEMHYVAGQIRVRSMFPM